MTVKDYLYSVRVSDKLIKTKEHELSKLRLNIAQVSVKQNEPVKTSGVNDPIGLWTGLQTFRLKSIGKLTILCG